MSPEDLALTFVRRWVSWYVRRLPDELAQRRYDEILADVHDHMNDERVREQAGWLVAAHVAWRTVKGMPADLLWRAEVRGRSRSRHGLRQLGVPTMNRFGPIGAVIGATATVLATSWLFVSVLMRRTRSWVQVEAGIVAWVAFGLALAAAVRWMPRRVAAGASLALAVISLADLLLEPFGRVAWIATSEYLWIALAALAFKGWTPEPATSRTTQDEPKSAQDVSASA